MKPEWNNAKLTQKQADEIRSKFVPHVYTMKQLAKEYSVSPRTIENILRYINWQENALRELILEEL